MHEYNESNIKLLSEFQAKCYTMRFRDLMSAEEIGRKIGVDCDSAKGGYSTALYKLNGKKKNKPKVVRKRVKREGDMSLLLRLNKLKFSEMYVS